MTILPALRFGVVASGEPKRDFGKPSFLRSRFVGCCCCCCRSSREGGGGVASGDEIDERELIEDGEPGAESVSGGVSISASSTRSAPSDGRISAAVASSAGDRDELLWRFAIDCELSDEADDSSNVRFGDLYIRDGLDDVSVITYARGSTTCEDDASVRGDTDREEGSGTCDGVKRAVACEIVLDGLSEERLTFAFVALFATTLDGGFLRTGDEDSTGDGGSSSSAGASCTLGSPACGPFRLRIDEKCSQSWYL